MYGETYDVQILEGEDWRDKSIGHPGIIEAKDWTKRSIPPTVARVRILCEGGAIYERTYDHKDHVKWVRRL